MKISARNNLTGKVLSIQDGTVFSEVVLEIVTGVEVAATVTKQSREKLGIEVGQDAHAIFKASHVMLGVPRVGHAPRDEVLHGSRVGHAPRDEIPRSACGTGPRLLGSAMPVHLG